MKKMLTLNLILSLFCLQATLLNSSELIKESPVISKYSYDQNGVRYQLVNHHPVENKNWNWIFIPGGPGCDSSSLIDLAKLQDLPGDTWLIDFPGSGSNINGISADYDYNQWFDFVIPMVNRFENPIIVGVSFGGMITLLTPELENHLKGVVILSSAPKMWLEEAAACTQKYNLPDFTPQLQEFIQNPSEETCKKLLDICVPYYFYKKESIEKGRALLLSIPFAFRPAFWWMVKASTCGYTATWVPQHVPTLVVGNEFDFMTPFEIFQNDTRFQRPNIKFVEIKEAGHFNWIDNPDEVKAAFEGYIEILN